MFPSTYQRIPEKPKYIMLKRRVMSATATANIQAIALTGTTGKIRITLDTVAGFAAGMKVTIASATSTANNGTFPILAIDVTNTYLYIENSAGVAQAGIAGTATLGGVVNYGIDTQDPNILKNANYDDIAYEYNEAGYFGFDIEDVLNKATAIQIVNTDSTNSITATVEWSLNNVNWLPFPTALTATLTAGTSAGFIIDHKVIGMFVRITITNASAATYYIIAR